MEEKNYLSVSQACEKFKTYANKIYYYINKKKIKCYYDGNKKMIDETELADILNKKIKLKAETILTPFGNISLDFDEVLKPIESIHNPNNVIKTAKYQTGDKYLVSNKGRVFNISKTREVQQSNSTHNYKQVCLRLADGTDCHERTHILVGMSFCPNRIGKEELHHIDGDKQNNNSINLIWLTKKQHVKAHQLMKSDTDAYNKFINEMQIENQYDKEYRCLLFPKENGNLFAWVTKEAYIDIQNGIDLFSISSSHLFKTVFIPNEDVFRR